MFYEILLLFILYNGIFIVFILFTFIIYCYFLFLCCTFKYFVKIEDIKGSRYRTSINIDIIITWVL